MSEVSLSSAVEPVCPVVWLTGLPASGKSTVAERLSAILRAQSACPLVLDGDELRQVLTPDATYTEGERDRFYRELGGLAAIAARRGVIPIVAATGPRQAHRDEAKKRVGRFVEVHLIADPEILEKRDPKGLYAASAAGKIDRLPGRGAPYEPPADPALVFDTGVETVDAIAGAIARFLGYEDPELLSAGVGPAVFRHPRTAVVGVDFSARSEVAYETALMLARDVGVSHLHLLHVLDRPGPQAYGYPSTLDLDQMRKERAEERLARTSA